MMAPLPLKRIKCDLIKLFKFEKQNKEKKINIENGKLTKT